jgi:type VI secretion system secreted protein Hcp
MAFHGYVSFKGSKQGQFKGESKKPARSGKWSEVEAFDFGVETPVDSNSGKPTGRRQHQPIKITKAFGNATPQLMQACSTNEVFSEVVIELIDSIPSGGERVVKRVTLGNAVIAGVRPHIGSAAASGRVLNDFTFDCGSVLHETLR